MTTLFHVLSFIIKITILSQTPTICNSYLTKGSSLSVVNKDDLLVSPNGRFTAGFHQVGENAYAFAVWFSEQTTPGVRRTVVWMANRDAPVNRKQSKFSLSENGNLVLTDSGDYIIWSTNTKSTTAEALLQLHNTGNLVLHGGKDSKMPLWQSFDHPTDTLLPGQPFTKYTQLVSSRGSADYSSGLYKLFFDNDSILRLLYDGPETTTVYWPHPSFRNWEVGRLQYVFSRRALLDFNGEFNSSDGFRFKSADFGSKAQRIMKLDIDGNLRVYSLVNHGIRGVKWDVQWQAIQHSCVIHGTCGPNSLCTYSHVSGSKCICLHGFKPANPADWRDGCEPDGFDPRNQTDSCHFDFIELPHAQFYGYDIRLLPNYTLNACKKYCLQDTSCKGFQYGWLVEKGFYYCFIKSSLYNGIQSGFYDPMYVKLPKRLVSSYHQQTVIKPSASCPPRPTKTPVVRFYDKKHHLKTFDFLLVLGCTIGIIEITCIAFFWYFTSTSTYITNQNYFPVSMGFRKFTYCELKKASRNFSEEIGRGGTCIVYKGSLKENKLVAIKRLKNTDHQGGEAEFQAEISTIGKVNHMNLIETLGYCAERKHRLVVYEYMENGSLADALGHGKLNWDTMFDIAKGTAKGLAYLHEECLEWVLHCDVKPHNILLDANYNPKVADFGLSKLYDRGGKNPSKFSMIRGTRGYMAPDWTFNLPITSKVDVYSYGVVILEMITGRSPSVVHQTSNERDETKLGLTDWVRLKMKKSTESWFEEIVDPSNSSGHDRERIQNLVRVALQCVEDDREARPSMSQVVNMIIHL